MTFAGQCDRGELIAAYGACRRRHLPRALGRAVGPGAAGGDGPRAPRGRHGARRLGRVPARRRELPAVRRRRCRAPWPRACGVSPPTRRCARTSEPAAWPPRRATPRPSSTPPSSGGARGAAVDAAAGERLSRRPGGRTILHVGTGFRPWRRGGLVAYVEDLMAEQVRRGHRVTYLFAGRLYPWGRAPRLRRWERDGVPMLEIVNSPLHDHGRQPELELSEPRIERLFDAVVREIAPDVVHVHELCGLPSLGARHRRRPGRAGRLHAPGLLRALPHVQAARPRRPSVPAARRRRGLRRDRRRTAPGPGASLRGHHACTTCARPLLRARLSRGVARRRSGPDRARGRPELFQRRRDLNAERLNRVDRLLAMSTRVAELHAELGVDPDRLQTMQLTLAHIERLRPRSTPRPDGPLTFATLGGGESRPKGRAGPARRVARTGPAGRGGRDPAAALRARRWALPARGGATLPGVELRRQASRRPTSTRYWTRRRRHSAVGVGGGLRVRRDGVPGQGHPGVANAIGGMIDYVDEGRDRLAEPLV